MHIDTVEADLAEYEPAAGGASWDVILAVFCALPPDVRQRLHRACAAALRPGGVFLFEDFAPAQAVRRAAEGPCWIAGPPAEWLVDADALAADLGALEIVVRRETIEERLVEGRFHRGRAALTQLVARRAPALDAAYRARIDAVFEEAIDGGGDGGDGGEVDLQLRSARASVRIACAAAERSGRCRYCWVERRRCMCAEVPPAEAPPPRLRWAIVVHPGEFLRSTSSGPARRPPRRRRAHRLRRRVPRGTARRALSGAGGRARPFSGAARGDGGRRRRAAPRSRRGGEEEPLTVLVPDGSWEGARARERVCAARGQGAVRGARRRARRVARLAAPRRAPPGRGARPPLDPRGGRDDARRGGGGHGGGGGAACAHAARRVRARPRRRERRRRG